VSDRRPGKITRGWDWGVSEIKKEIEEHKVHPAEKEVGRKRDSGGIGKTKWEDYAN